MTMPIFILCLSSTHFASWLYASAAPSLDWRLASSPTNNLCSRARFLPQLCPSPDPVANESELPLEVVPIESDGTREPMCF
jgi:hypothetical protein